MVGPSERKRGWSFGQFLTGNGIAVQQKPGTDPAIRPGEGYTCNLRILNWFSPLFHTILFSCPNRTIKLKLKTVLCDITQNA
jgi:hypothetical protein